MYLHIIPILSFFPLKSYIYNNDTIFFISLFIILFKNINLYTYLKDFNFNAKNQYLFKNSNLYFSHGKTMQYKIHSI